MEQQGDETVSMPSSSRKKQDISRSASILLSSLSVFLRQASGFLVGDVQKDGDGVAEGRNIWTCDIITYNISTKSTNLGVYTSANSDNVGRDQNSDDYINLSSPLRPLLPQQQSNTISTTKYTLLSWLPVSMLEQFKRVANFYFLVISILMIVGTYCPQYFISPLDPGSTAVTLVVVLLISSLKEGYEDYGRYRYDCIENEREAIICTYDKETGEMHETRKPSSDIKCGDIIKLEGRSIVPADLVLLHSSTYDKEANLGSQCYVETSNIDGECNLKVKEAPSFLLTLPISCPSSGIPPPTLFDGYIEYESPTKNIHNFIGALHLNSFPDVQISLSTSNLLLRSSLFSNTDWGYGVAVYTGQSTKVISTVSLT